MHTLSMDDVTASKAVADLSLAVSRAYGARLKRLVPFGSRARGDAREDSDVDLAPLLDEMHDRWAERDHLAHIAHEVIVDTHLEVQPWVLSSEEWDHPQTHSNPRPVEAMRAEGVPISFVNYRLTVPTI